jgi:hypothetical protein
MCLVSPWTTKETSTKTNAAETVGIEEIFADFKATNREQMKAKGHPQNSNGKSDPRRFYQQLSKQSSR